MNNTLDHTSNYKKQMQPALDEGLRGAMREHQYAHRPRYPTRPSKRFSSVMNYQLSKEESYVRDLELATGSSRLQKVSSEAEETGEGSTRHGELLGTVGSDGGWGWGGSGNDGGGAYRLGWDCGRGGGVGGWVHWDWGVGWGTRIALARAAKLCLETVEGTRWRSTHSLRWSLA